METLTISFNLHHNIKQNIWVLYPAKYTINVHPSSLMYLKGDPLNGRKCIYKTKPNFRLFKTPPFSSF